MTLLLLALQTGLLDLQIFQRTFLLSIILFIVGTSTLQSMIEIADPIVLALGASRNRYRGKEEQQDPACPPRAGGQSQAGTLHLLLAARFGAESVPEEGGAGGGVLEGGCFSQGWARPH